MTRNRATRAPLLALDVSALWKHPTTGIQRVIRETTPFLAKAAATRGWEVALTRAGTRGLLELARWPAQVAPEQIRRDLDRIAAGATGWWRRCIKQLAWPFAAALQLSGAEQWLRGVPGFASAARFARSSLASVLDRWSPMCARADAYLSFSAGILPCRVPRLSSAERAVFILHDLIPLHHACYSRPIVVRAFLDNLASLAVGPYARVGRFITASRHVAGDLETLFHALARVRVAVDLIDWGYDPEKFFPEPDPAFRRNLGIAPDAVLVVAVSSQDPRKRFSDIQKAMNQGNAYAVFLGNGRRRREGNAIYLGHVSDTMVRRAYSSCDVVVNWSAAEGFGLPIVEALACGARVVVPPDNPILQEIGGDNVIVAERADVPGLRAAVEQSIHSAPRGRLDLSRFNWATAARTLEAALWRDVSSHHIAA